MCRAHSRYYAQHSLQLKFPTPSVLVRYLRPYARQRLFLRIDQFIQRPPVGQVRDDTVGLGLKPGTKSIPITTARTGQPALAADADSILWNRAKLGDFPFQFNDLPFQPGDPVIIVLMMNHELLQKGPDNQAEQDIEEKHQEQLEFPMCRVKQQRPECFMFHGFVALDPGAPRIP